MSHRQSWHVVLVVLALSGAAARADAQGFGDRLKRAATDAAKRKVEQRVEEKAEAAADATLDGAEKRAKAAVKGDSSAGEKAGEKTAPKAEPRSGTAAGTTRPPVPAAAAADASAAPAPVRTNAGRDFTPGTRVLFATDFARDEIGDFPRAFRLKTGNAEVADVGGTRWLRVTSDTEFEIPLPEKLPEMFTLEIEFAGPYSTPQAIYFTDDDEAHHVVFRPRDGGIRSDVGGESVTQVTSTKEDVPFRLQVMADGDYVKVYLDGTRVANVPNARMGRADRVRFHIRGTQDGPTLVGNVRIAAGGKDLYKALTGEGRVTADGILFDTNSDRLRPESDAVLREIGDMLAKHPELRLSIEGHTDDVGAAAANLALSQKRAEAVRTHLVGRYGVAADRLEAKGHGASKPVVANDGEAARQRNRRVELVKR